MTTEVYRGRHHEVSGITLSLRRMREDARAYARTATAVHLVVLQGGADDDDLPKRPMTRGECADVPRPCPFVSCRHHLYLDAKSTGSIRLTWPDLDPGDLPANGSCSLDVADGGPETLDGVGEHLNLTRERVRQYEEAALRRVGPAMRAYEGGSK